MRPFSNRAADEPHPDRAGDDPEVPERDAAEQRQEEDGEDVQERPTTAPPLEASEADALEQEEEVPMDDEYEGEP